LFGLSGYIRCRLCQLSIKCSRNGCESSQSVIDHALGQHLKKALFACRLCSVTATSRKTITAHLNQSHRMSVIGNCIDNSANHEGEILRVLSECFDYGETKDQKRQSTKRKIGGRGGQNESSVVNQQPNIKRAKVSASKAACESSASTSGHTAPQESASTSAMVTGLEKCGSCPYTTKNAKLMKRHTILFHFCMTVNG